MPAKASRSTAHTAAPKKHRHPSEYSQVIASEKRAQSHWNAFMIQPENMEYESQLEGETILLFLRQHPIVNLSWIALAAVMLILPLLLMPFFPPFLMLPAAYKFVLFLSWNLLVLGFAVERVLMWLFNSFIITDERIIDIDFYSLIYKIVNYAQIDKIEDVDTRVGGVLFSLLDAGDVVVQTAAEIPQFEIDRVPHPSKVAKLLSELMVEEEQEKHEGRVR